MRKNDLTTEARKGYDGNPPDALYSSPVWFAQSLGAYLHATGRPVPRGVRMGRGYTMHANDMRFGHVDGTHWERLS